jgi:four helix bundle protein
MAQHFADLIVWQEAATLAADVLQLAPRLRGFCPENLAMQVVRAAESVPSNVAEGYGRGINRDCCRFLNIARASALEVENHMMVAVRQGRIQQEDVAPVLDRAARVRYLIARFRQSVERRMKS